MSIFADLELMLDVVANPTEAASVLRSRPRFWLPVSILIAVQVGRMFLYFNPSGAPAKLLVTVVIASIPVLFQVGLVTFLLVAGVLLTGGTVSALPVAALTASVLAVRDVMRFVWAALEYTLGTPGSGIGGPVYSNLGFLVPPDSFALHAAAAAVDVTAIVTVVLLGLGLSTISERVSRPRALVLCALPWVLAATVSVGLKIYATR